MKYARLSLADLKDLEKEFVEFLIINGITADDWEKLKKEDIIKAEKIINQFSDVVWEGILRKNNILELRRTNRLTICRVKEGKIETLYVNSEVGGLDLSDTKNIDKIVENVKDFKYSYQKTSTEKEDTIQLFELIRSGFFLASNKAYAGLLDSLSKVT